MKLLCSLAMIAAVAVIQVVHAGRDHHPKHGGQVQETTSYDLELVSKDKELALHVADHQGRKSDIKEAVAIVLTGKLKETVRLVAGNDGVLKGTSNATVTADTKIIVSIMSGGKTEQARFATLQNAKVKDHKGHKH